MKKISDRNIRSYYEQYWYAENVLTGFLNIDHSVPLRICEIGPAEGGALKYFTQHGHECCGIELSDNRHENSIILNSDFNIKFIKGTITQPESYLNDIPNNMDVVICRDVIEHIDQDKKIVALKNMADLLKPNGQCFISFPPKYSPYAGHQQTAPSVLAKLPYLFCLPDALYSGYLTLCRTPRAKIQGLLRVKSVRLSIRQFEELVTQLPLSIIKRQLYIIRPAHENRYKIKRLKQPFNSPLVREWLSTGALYCLEKN
jgi:2-polyprenyl-3-methyl-5-hydroxy-6-metoxy-1,4-benzoquinol methylase